MIGPITCAGSSEGPADRWLDDSHLPCVYRPKKQRCV